MVFDSSVRQFDVILNGCPVGGDFWNSVKWDVQSSRKK